MVRDRARALQLGRLSEGTTNSLQVPIVDSPVTKGFRQAAERGANGQLEWDRQYGIESAVLRERPYCCSRLQRVLRQPVLADPTLTSESVDRRKRTGARREPLPEWMRRIRWYAERP